MVTNEICIIANHSITSFSLLTKVRKSRKEIVVSSNAPPTPQKITDFCPKGLKWVYSRPLGYRSVKIIVCFFGHHSFSFLLRFPDLWTLKVFFYSIHIVVSFQFQISCRDSILSNHFYDTLTLIEKTSRKRWPEYTIFCLPLPWMHDGRFCFRLSFVFKNCSTWWHYLILKKPPGGLIWY